jgi:hypothetical protein|tara:strand:- start:73 stop:429 length:357 start_codon:yes stop_codon:yes gene_type:complete
MANYEMYFCLPSSAYDSAVGTKIKELYPIVESVDEDTGDITYKSSPTWNDIIFAGKVGAPRYSHDKAYCLIKGEWSMKNGVLSELIALGASKSYPNFSVLTKSEAQALASSNVFVEDE